MVNRSCLRVWGIATLVPDTYKSSQKSFPERGNSGFGNKIMYFILSCKAKYVMLDDDERQDVTWVMSRLIVAGFPPLKFPHG